MNLKRENCVLFLNSYILIYIYKQKGNIMAEKTQLTSVKILTDLYKSFKIHTITDGITLQKLVNRSLNLYMTDNSYRETLTKHSELQVSGSQF